MRANQRGLWPNKKAVHKRTDSLFGTPGAIRTHDLQYRKLTLYPAELRVHNTATITDIGRIINIQIKFNILKILIWQIIYLLDLGVFGRMEHVYQ